MVAMQALRRDVLQWLVSLNLPFPIKNIKRYKPADLEGEELWHGIPDSNALFTTNNLPSLSKEECKLLNNDESLDTLLIDEAMEKEIFPATESTKITAREQEDEQSTLVEMDIDKEELGSSLNEIVWVSSEGQTDKKLPLMVTEKTRKVSANAVERARQKDRKSRHTHDSVNAKPLTEVSEVSCNLKSRDINLAFRSPNRQREFRSYTLKDYRKQQPGVYIELGRLGPDTTTESLLNQRDKLEKMKAFGRSARDINILQTTESRKPKDKLPSCREKAIEFASKIPKPRKKILQKENLKDPLESPVCPLTELEKMEAKHQKDRQHIEAIRRDLECFLR